MDDDDLSYARSELKLIHNKIMMELRNRPGSKRKVQAISILTKMGDIFADPLFNLKWNKQSTEKVHKHMGLFENKTANINSIRKDVFHINILLADFLRTFSKTNYLSISTWPKVNLFPRADLAVQKDEGISELLSDFHELVQLLAKKKPNIGTAGMKMMPLLILRLIAIDGVLVGDADWKIAHLETQHIHIGKPNIMELHVGKNDRPKKTKKQYPITSVSTYACRILINRAKHDGESKFLFPSSWRKSQDKKKTIRRIVLEESLASLWHTAFPSRAMPTNLNVPMWIKLSIASFDALGVPSVCIATARNKIRGAQLSIGNIEPIKIRNRRRAGPLKTCFEDVGRRLMRDIQHLIEQRDKKSATQGDKIPLANEIDYIINQTAKSEPDLPESWQLLSEWFGWLLRWPDLKKLTISTIYTHTSVISNHVFPALKGRKISELSLDEWEDIAELTATNQDYLSSSRRAALTHLQRFHFFLQKRGINVPNIDWSSYRWRVEREFAECPVISPDEVDVWLQYLSPSSTAWISGVLGFYCGLRCEEIFHLSPSSFIDDSRLLIRISKLNSSRRCVPVGWLTPEEHYKPLMASVKQIAEEYGNHCSLIDPEGQLKEPGSLSKSVGRSMKRSSLRSSKMHALRHGFASWGLIRYYTLTDKDFRKCFYDGHLISGVNVKHPLFKKESMSKYAFILGGHRWYQNYIESGECPGTPLDMVPIAKLLGHTNRFTMLENYMNSLVWVQDYYMLRRQSKILTRNT